MASPGILTHTNEEIRTNVETNIDIQSAMSWYAVGGIYSAAKAALWSATNSLRLELAPEGVHVVGVHVGYVDTAMAAQATDPKMDPADLVRTVADLVRTVMDAVEAGETSVQLKAGLSAPIEALYPQLAHNKA